MTLIVVGVQAGFFVGFGGATALMMLQGPGNDPWARYLTFLYPVLVIAGPVLGGLLASWVARRLPDPPPSPVSPWARSLVGFATVLGGMGGALAGFMASFIMISNIVAFSLVFVFAGLGLAVGAVGAQALVARLFPWRPDQDEAAATRPQAGPYLGFNPIFGAIATILGFGLLWVGVREALHGYQSNSWTAAPGIISRSEVKAKPGDSTTYSPDVVYEYSVNTTAP